MSGILNADDKVYSQYQLAEMFNINPATAAKALNILADGGILFKKRGLGMFVSTDAKDLVFAKRKEQKLKSLVTDLVWEAKYLGVNEEELIKMIQEESRRNKEE